MNNTNQENRSADSEGLQNWGVFGKMKMIKIIPIAKNVLLVFVLITIGFAWGKESTLRRIAATPPVQTARSTTEVATDAEGKVVVYYAHTTFRCVTCNTIEKLTEQTLRSLFSDELANGVIEWHVVNFQEDENFAKCYSVVSSTVVVCGVNGDGEMEYERLDNVWNKMKDPAAFEEYVAQAVRKRLLKKGEVSE